MDRTKLIFLVLWFIGFSLLNSCRTTEHQILKSRPTEIQELSGSIGAQKSVELPAQLPPVRKGTRVPWFLFAAALVGGVLMIFRGEGSRARKHRSSQQRAKSKRRTKK